MSEAVRKFETGATRSADATRYDPEGFMSPIVIERFCEYMSKHRHQPDGSIRDSDNWQKGIPLPTYVKGMWRHFLHLWTRHRGFQVQDTGAAADMEEDLCAILFNASGLLFELLKHKRRPAPHIDPQPVKISPEAKTLSDYIKQAQEEEVRERGRILRLQGDGSGLVD